MRSKNQERSGDLKNNRRERNSDSKGKSGISNDKTKNENKPGRRLNKNNPDSKGKLSIEKRNDKKEFREDRKKDKFRKPLENFSGSDKKDDRYRRPGADDSGEGKKFVKFRRTSGYKKTSKASKNLSGDGMRLNRFIATAGICSRREADEYIEAGLVKVNDKIVTTLGTKINEDDVIKFNGEIIKTERKIYILLNKPKDYITTVEDPHATKTVLDLIKGACRERVYPVGRLDRMSTGLLLITNDGELTKKLTHPKYNKKKIYHVQLNKALKKDDLYKITQGIELEDGFVKPDAINYVEENDKSILGIEIHSGRNRIIRRLFEFLDYSVQKLDRVYYAGLTKKNLPRGKWRFLTDIELSILKSGKYL